MDATSQVPLGCSEVPTSILQDLNIRMLPKSFGYFSSFAVETFSVCVPVSRTTSVLLKINLLPMIRVGRLSFKTHSLRSWNLFFIILWNSLRSEDTCLGSEKPKFNSFFILWGSMTSHLFPLRTNNRDNLGWSERWDHYTSSFSLFLFPCPAEVVPLWRKTPSNTRKISKSMAFYHTDQGLHLREVSSAVPY